jgi:hypothetical protein
MTYTIKDLREGKCAVANDGDLEQLRKVLKKAFYKYNHKTYGFAPYYAKDDLFWDLKYPVYKAVDYGRCFLPIQSASVFYEQLTSKTICTH